MDVLVGLSADNWLVQAIMLGSLIFGKDWLEGRSNENSFMEYYCNQSHLLC